MGCYKFTCQLSIIEINTSEEHQQPGTNCSGDPSLPLTLVGKGLGWG